MSHILVATALRWVSGAFDPTRSEEERRARILEILDLISNIGAD